MDAIPVNKYDCYLSAISTSHSHYSGLLSRRTTGHEFGLWGNLVDRLVAVSIKPAGQWVESWTQRAALSIFEGIYLGRSEFRRAAETKKCSKMCVEQYVTAAVRVADYYWLSGIEHSR